MICYRDITIRSYGGLRPVLGGKYEEQIRNRKIVHDTTQLQANNTEPGELTKVENQHNQTSF